MTGRDRFSTATRLRRSAQQAQARVYRAAAGAGAPRAQPAHRPGRAARAGAVLAGGRARLPDAAVRLPALARSPTSAAGAGGASSGWRSCASRRPAGRTPRTSSSQAREQLHYVMPGETGYTVVGPAPADAQRPTAAARPPLVREPLGRRRPRRRALVRRHRLGRRRTAADAGAGTGRRQRRPPADRPPRRRHAHMDTPPPPTPRTAPTDADSPPFKQQLGRPPRGLRAIAHRCPCGSRTSSRPRRAWRTARPSRRCTT